MSKKGLAWPLVRESLQENNTIENMERIFKAAKAHGFEVFISPHYFYPTDKGWKFNGPLETDEATSGMFARKGVLNLDGFEGSGADWLERFKPYIEDGKTIVVAPHRVWGPETNDLVLQLRKRKISRITLGGMLANICLESHLRELLEQGFEVAVAKDATAAPIRLDQPWFTPPHRFRSPRSKSWCICRGSRFLRNLCRSRSISMKGSLHC